MRREATHPALVQGPLEKGPLGCLIRKMIKSLTCRLRKYKDGDEENGLGPNAMMDFGNSDVETVGYTVTQPYVD
jgi:hypothetical protein